MSTSSDTPVTAANTATPASGWKPQLPSRVRARPRAYGTGRYGTTKYDDRDNTRYAWSRVVPAITALALAFLTFAAPVRAQTCENADTLTTNYQLCKPSVDVEGAIPWGTKWNGNADIVDADLALVAQSTSAFAPLISTLGASTATIAASVASLNTVKASTGTCSLPNVLVTVSSQNVVCATPTNTTGNSATSTLATTATNIAAGGAGQLPYQSASGTTAMLAAGANTQVLVGGAAAPAWSTLAGSTANVNIAGLSARATALGSTPSQCSSGNYPLGIDANGNAQNCTAGGVGDAVRSSTQTFSGIDTFAGAVVISSGIAVSSRTANLAGITITASAYAVGVDTLTLTVTGLNPIEFCYSGGANVAATNGVWGWSFLVDGLYITTSGLSSTVGMNYGDTYSGSGFVGPPMAGCYRVSAGEIAAGSHKFIFVAEAEGSVLKFGYQNAVQKTAPHAWVTEIH